jgi:DnaK suppressor protein
MMATTPDHLAHLNASQLSRLQSQLEAERSRLQAKIRAARGKGGTDGEAEDPLLKEPEDFAEMAQDITIEETELAITANEQGILAQIENALQRMRDGTYGLSEVSGKPIPYERLEALPWATTNVDDPR